MPCATEAPTAASRKRRSSSAATTDNGAGASTGAASPNAPNPPTEGGDHRKKRRNRTTQSCLNCHTSKRMCDRRRPACARCTQLGLTGLCIYEVDDPNQRADLSDETARLTTRVAELEGVIREMKNKPHPRWLQPSDNLLSDISIDKWARRSQQQRLSADGDSRSTSESPSSPGASDASHSERSPYTRLSNHRRRTSLAQGVNTYPNIPADPPPLGHSPFAQSPQSTPSPLVSTPVEDFSRPQVAISSGVPQDYNLAAMLLSYPPSFRTGHDDYTGIPKDSMDAYAHISQPESVYCGCADDSHTYNVLLELSLRLRKAASTMAGNPNHQCSGSCCALYRQVSELDKYVSDLLGNTVAPLTTAPAHEMPPSNSSSYGNANSPSTYTAAYPSHHAPAAVHPAPVSSSLINGLQSWDLSNRHPHHHSPQLSNQSLEAPYSRWEQPAR